MKMLSMLSLCLISGCTTFNQELSPTVYNPNKLPDDDLAYFFLAHKSSTNTRLIAFKKKDDTEDVATLREGMWLEPGEYILLVECEGKAGHVGKISSSRGTEYKFLPLENASDPQIGAERIFVAEKGYNYQLFCGLKTGKSQTGGPFPQKYFSFKFTQWPYLQRTGDYVTCAPQKGGLGVKCVKESRN